MRFDILDIRVKRENGIEIDSNVNWSIEFEKYLLEEIASDELWESMTDTFSSDKIDRIRSSKMSRSLEYWMDKAYTSSHLENDTERAIGFHLGMR